MTRIKTIWVALVVAAVAITTPQAARADHGDHHGGHGNHGGWHGGNHYSSHYSNRSYYYNSYGYRPYGYGYGYRSGYYGYGYRPYYRSYSWWPSFNFSFFRSAAPTAYYGTSQDDVAVDVQRALARRGYYRGPIDGDVGPMTRAAIRAYQVDRGLPLTGRIDGSLVRSLGV